MRSCVRPQLVRISAARSNAQRPTLPALPRPPQTAAKDELHSAGDQTCLNCSIIIISSNNENDNQKRFCQ